MIYDLRMKYIFTLLCAFFFAPQVLFAAEFYFVSDEKEIRVGDELKTDVFLDAPERVNAIEGTIIFPTDIVALKEIRDGNSAINFWIERPGEVSSGAIRFSGITPGGFSGGKNFIFSLIFEGAAEGVGDIRIENARVLLNDGAGTEAPLTITPLPLSILPQTGEKRIVATGEDTEPPESFAPEIGSDPEIFDGRWFVAFMTQDKNSGIDRYYIYESPHKRIRRITDDEWVPAASPHLLDDQELTRFIYIKAVDRSGNERIEIVPPRYPRAWYESRLNWSILIISILLAYFIRRMVTGNQSSKVKS